MAHCSFCEMTESEAIYAERERIIKLLEDDAETKFGDCGDRDPVTKHLDEWCNCRIIALIKGENK